MLPSSRARRLRIGRGALGVAVAFATLAVSLDALADRVASLSARGPAPLAERTSIKQSTDLAAKALGHELVPESDVLQGEAAAGEKAGTSEGCIAIGKATSSDWVVEASVASSAAGTRVEMKACQVSTGRVETVARDLDPKGDPVAQLREMLAVLLRPQGLGDEPLPWQNKPAAPPKPPPEVLPKKTQPPPPKPAEPAPPPPKYGEGGRVALGVSGGVLDVLARPDAARGSRLVGTWSLVGAFAIPARPSVEIVARAGGMHGPGDALFGEVGARYVTTVAGPVALGIGASIGAFGALGGAQQVRPLFGLSPTIAFTITRWLQLEIDAGALRVAPGEGGALLFAGGTASALARF